MALNGTVVAVDDSEAVEVVPATGDGFTGFAFIKNVTGSDTVYLGGPGVDTDGYPLAADESVTLADLRYGDSVYAICDTSESADVKVLYRGV